MTYEEAVSMMIEKGKVAATQGVEDYSIRFRPESKFPEITLEYPGYPNKRKNNGWKKIIGDYRMVIIDSVSNKRITLSHFDMCKKLFELSKGKYDTYWMFLDDICLHGTNIEYSQYALIQDAEKLAAMLFWLTVQEDINYPRGAHNEGHYLSFYRFFEAVYAAEYDSKIMDDLENRCLQDDHRHPPLYNLGDAPHPSFYNFLITF